jgi:ribosomal protein L20
MRQIQAAKLNEKPRKSKALKAKHGFFAERRSNFNTIAADAARATALRNCHPAKSLQL